MTKAIITLTSKEIINITLDEACAPISTANFIKLAKEGFYTDTVFHRIIKNFMIQGGGMLANMASKESGLKAIKGEFIANGVKNTRKHKAGTISMARTTVMNSATSQFFICSADTPFLDGQYAAFGEVSDAQSMATVMKLGDVATGNSGYHSDVPIVPIVIESIVIVE